jgi:lipopolysaccharide biosynthesis glycosyltransferase
MLHSLIACHGDHDVHVHYLHGPEFPRRARERIGDWLTAEGATIEFTEIPDEELEGVPTKGFTRKATWYRIFLPQLLPDVERVLYLDSDLIVVDTLAPLWELDLTGHWVGAVTNVFQHNHVHRPAELGLAGTHVYFNAGVLLMNLAEMRRDDCTAALLAYAREDPERIAWRDQDALNVVLGEGRLPLHPRWNCMNAFFVFDHAADAFPPGRLDEAKASPAIRHFEGPEQNKPWHYLCERELRDLYAEHRRGTPFPRFRREGVTLRNVVRRLSA